MSAEVALERNGRMVRYRPVTIAHNWAKSEFEYFSTVTQEWRKVINWNTRERLFVLVATGVDIFRAERHDVGQGRGLVRRLVW